MPAHPEVVAYIRDAAARRGIDPDIALRVAMHEGAGVFDPNKPDLGGDERSSFGPFQLHYGGMSKSMPHAGLGDDFTAKTGLRADNPATWRQQVDFSLDHVLSGGWSPWMGAKAEGITGYMGVGGKRGPALSTPTYNSSAGGPGGGTPTGETPTAANMAGPTPTPTYASSGGGPGGGTKTGQAASDVPPATAVAGGAYPPAPAAPTPQKGWRDMLATSMAGFGKGMESGMGQGYQTPRLPSVNAPSIALPAAPVIDPNAAANQRQMMAQAIARLNAGQLYG